MVEQVTFQTVFQFLQTMGILVGVFYYISTIRTNQKNQELTLETRQLQLYNSAFLPAQSREFMLGYVDVVYNHQWKDFDEFMEKYGPYTNPEAYTSVVLVLELFQKIGLYVEQKALGIDLVNRHCGKVVVRVWEKLYPFVKEFRALTNNPFHWHSFEYLFDEMKKINP